MWGVLVFKEIKVILLGLLPNLSCLPLALGTVGLVIQLYLLDFTSLQVLRCEAESHIVQY